MAAPRFYHSPLPSAGEVALGDSEARHASNVLRLSVGDRVVLFDGQGGEAGATVCALSKRGVSVAIWERSDTNRELARPLEMVVALPKGDRQRTLVDGLVQLGVTRLTPLISQRGVAQPTAAALERLQRSVVESSKQCGRNQLMHISTPQTIAHVVRASIGHPSILKLVAHPHGTNTSLCEAINNPDCPPTASRMAVGPEGGFSDAEVSQWLEAGWQGVDLGPRILRIEMAALQMAAWWACHFETKKG